MSPVGRLESLSAAIMEEEESAVEITAAKLSVRLLLPTGLCFLPAFILVGVLPSVVAFAGG
jgi:pilus assembly protein TadC